MHDNAINWGMIWPFFWGITADHRGRLSPRASGAGSAVGRPRGRPGYTGGGFGEGFGEANKNPFNIS